MTRLHLFPGRKVLAAASLLAAAAGLAACGNALALDCIEAPADYQCSAVDVPGSFSTRVNGINNTGAISGYYETPGVSTFRRVGSNFDLPAMPAGAAAAYGFGLNDAGHIVGYTLGGGGYQGFVWNGNQFSSFAFAANVPTFAFGINNTGTIVGAYQTSPTTASGFLRDGSGVQTTVNVGNARSTYVYGVNDGGTLAGTYISTSGDIVGFKGTASTHQDVRVPGARQTYVRGINNIGDVVGSYVDAAGATKGFAQLTDGSFWTFAVSDALRTNVLGINDQRAVAGFYALDEYFTHGFTAELKPLPIPPAAAMLAAGLVLMGTRLRRRKASGASVA